MLGLLNDFKHTQLLRHANFMLIPVSVLNTDEEGMSIFNKIYDYIKSYPEIHQIVRTKSGGISIDRSKLRLPAFDVRATNTCIELTILIKEGMWRFQFRTISYVKEDTEEQMYGRQAFNIFKKICLEHGIDLNDYAITDGEEVKKTIEKPIISLERDSSANRTYDHVHHIDFHNSYPAGLCNKYPEFLPVIQPIYDERKQEGKEKINKAILNYTIGFMQSMPGCKAKWAHLSKAAIADNNRRIRDLANRLRNSGRVILSYNTDGIWYTGDVYHGSGEGKDLGQWENDHIDCRFRAKSAGCYEFIENGKYKAVVRGMTKLDKIKDRDEWQWGDIYNKDCNPIKYYFKENIGIIKGV